jgi:hypothetical protein
MKFLKAAWVVAKAMVLDVFAEMKTADQAVMAGCFVAGAVSGAIIVALL